MICINKLERNVASMAHDGFISRLNEDHSAGQLACAEGYKLCGKDSPNSKTEFSATCVKLNDRCPINGFKIIPKSHELYSNSSWA